MARFADALSLGPWSALRERFGRRQPSNGDRKRAARREREQDLHAARAAFAQFAALEAAHDCALLDLYSEDGVVIERWIENGVERPTREFPLRRYKERLAKALAISAKAGETSTHDDVRFDLLAPGWVLVRSRRTYSHARAAAPYEATLRREPDGQWRVTKEIATLVL